MSHVRARDFRRSFRDEMVDTSQCCVREVEVILVADWVSDWSTGLGLNRANSCMIYTAKYHTGRMYFWYLIHTCFRSSRSFSLEGLACYSRLYPQKLSPFGFLVLHSCDWYEGKRNGGGVQTIPAFPNQGRKATHFCFLVSCGDRQGGSVSYVFFSFWGPAPGREPHTCRCNSKKCHSFAF